MSTVKDTLKDLRDRLIAFGQPKQTDVKDAEVVETKVEFGQIKLEGQDVIFEFEGEELVAGINVFAIDPEDAANRIPVPVGEYPLEDGQILVVTEEGIVGEVKTPGEEPAPEQADEAATDMSDVEGAQAKAEAVKPDIKSILIKYQTETDKKFQDINEKLDAVLKLSGAVEELKKEVVAFGEQPSAKPKKRVEVKRATTKQGRIADAIRNAQ